jgi:pimeloyl-ACP methyl ester carboxylesterase
VSGVEYFQNRDGQRLAYVAEGEGPTLLLPSWWASHLDADAEDPAYRSFFRRLASRFRVVRYDRVGVGMSDRARRAYTLDSELDDFASLVDHIGVARFDLLGCHAADRSRSRTLHGTPIGSGASRSLART